MEKDLLPIILERSHQSGRWLMTGKGQMSPSRQTIREREASCLFHPSVLGLWSKSPWKSFIHTQGQASSWEQAAWIHQSQMVPAQSDCPLWRNYLLWKIRAMNIRYLLPVMQSPSACVQPYWAGINYGQSPVHRKTAWMARFKGLWLQVNNLTSGW